MRVLDGNLLYSASDLVAHASCEHRTELTLAHKLGLTPITPDKVEGMAALAGERGTEHEKKVWDSLSQNHQDAINLSDLAYKTTDDLIKATEATLEAMESGVSLIYQGIFFDGQFIGYPDFLRRVDIDPVVNPRGYTYEVIDAKLKRSLSSTAVIQMAAYNRQLRKMGFSIPESMSAFLGDFKIEQFPVANALPYVDRLSAELEQKLAEPAVVPAPIWSEKITACESCIWATVCETGREQERDLSLIAKMRGDQRKKLIEAGITSIEAFAQSPDEARPKSMSRGTWERLRHQAILQSKQDQDPNHAVLSEVFSNDGLELMPAPSNGDVWFDMEGDPFAEPPQGLEYLFGAITFETGTDSFTDFWAHNPAEEKLAFENFVDWIEIRRQQYPDMHVYHYASYERTRMGSLASRYATREDIIDDWFRKGILVDLLTVVSRSIRVSQRSYSIKKLEPLYGFYRDQEVKTAGDSVVDYEKFLELTDSGESAKAQELLDGIRDYNKADCISTRLLDAWLREISTSKGVTPKPFEESIPKEDVDDADGHLVQALINDVSFDRSRRSPQEAGQAALAAAVGYHRREEKPAWWEYFHNIEADPDEWNNQDKVAVVIDVDTNGWQLPSGKGTKLRRILKLNIDGGQGLKLGVGSTALMVFDEHPDIPDQVGMGSRFAHSGKVLVSESGYLEIQEYQIKDAPNWAALPLAIIEGKPISTEVLYEGTLAAAETARAELPAWPTGPAFDLLLRAQPSLGKVNLHQTGDQIRDIVKALTEIDSSYLAVQGPPGSGKTYLTARVIKDLVETHNWRIGVVGQSHKVIENLLAAIVNAGLDPNLIAKKPQYSGSMFPWQSTDNVADWVVDQSKGFVIGGTGWNFRSPGFVQLPKLDLMVIDEAGQYSLANTISMSTVTKRLLLVGDQQQLPQVSRGSHPEPVDISALEWLLDGKEVIPDEFGYFLDKSFRMHPDLCAQVSQLSYKGLLQSATVASKRHLAESQPGLHAVEVAHHDNATSSIEEVQEVIRIAQSVIGRNWTDADGTRPLQAKDVMVVAPYNAQVNLLKRELSNIGLEETPVGTVDKFQGQQAPIVIMSMTASSIEGAPRAWEFLLSRNRLNVGISRGQWATYLLYSPELLRTPVTRPGQIALVSGLLSLAKP